MESIIHVLLVALVVEAVVEVLKYCLPKNEKEGLNIPVWTWPLVSIALGVALCLLGGVDMLSEAGLWLSVPYVGQVLTGVLVSRGSNFIHELWKKIKV